MVDSIPTPEESMVVLLQANIDALERRADIVSAELAAVCKEIAGKRRELDAAKFKAALVDAHAQVALRNALRVRSEKTYEVAQS